MAMNPSLISIAGAVGHALFTGLWLGALLALILFFIGERLRGTNAATRHAMWYAGLIAIASVPVASVAWSFDHAVTIAAPAEQLQTAPWRPAALKKWTTSNSAHGTRTQAAARGSSPAVSDTNALSAAKPEQRPFDFTPYLLGALGIALFGALIGVGGIGVSLVRLLAVKRESRPFDPAIAARLRRWSARPAIGRDVALRVSQGLDVPAAVGFAHPAILVPASWPANLDIDELDSIVMHEYSHLRRCDDWWALLQRIAERAYWFNPALRFIAARANLEREIACDDWVVTEASNATSYAECLWRIAQFAHIPQPRLPVPAALVTRAQIVERIEHLMDAKRDSLPHVRPTALLAIVPLAALLLVVGVVRAPAVTITQAAPPASVTAPVVNEPGHTAVKPPRVSYAVTQVWKAQPLAKPLAQPLAKPAAQPLAKPAAQPNPPILPTSARSSRPQLSSLSKTRYAAGTEVALSGLDVRMLLQSCQGCDLSGKDLRNADLHGLNLSGDDMSHVDLRGANLRGTRFDGVDLSGSRLDGADLTDAEFSGSNIANISWTGAILTNAKFQGIKIDSAMVKAGMLRHMLSSCEGCDMQGLDLHGTDLSGIRLDGADLSDADLRDANLSHAKLNGVDLKGARLDGTDLTDAELNGCDLTSVDLSHAKIQGLKLQGADLRGLHFSGLDVRGLTADGADLSGASLAHVDLSGVHMDGSDFRNADLTAANLSDGDFSGADFRYSHLDNADFRRAALCGYNTFTDDGGTVLQRKKECADFSGATTHGTDLRGARICDERNGEQRCSAISAADLRLLSHSDLTGALLPDF
ncbi:MAG TPA: pentapeptide repeat-containing protein [Candidatus Eremiobacteraceae bacterium]|nr:pentapeptide repeat-containing protein [Candidatus Eremiobacteraceae bacterium]